MNVDRITITLDHCYYIDAGNTMVSFSLSLYSNNALVNKHQLSPLSLWQWDPPTDDTFIVQLTNDMGYQYKFQISGQSLIITIQDMDVGVCTLHFNLAEQLNVHLRDFFRAKLENKMVWSSSFDAGKFQKNVEYNLDVFLTMSQS